MPGNVKRTRRYESRLRREQAAATRSRILDAAQRLFERDGYVSTTMAGVAAEAGVSLKTVYLAFETKTGLLRALWNARLRGDEKPVPVGERAWYRAVLEEPDPERKLRLDVRNARAARERLGPLLRVVRDTAPVEPEIADLWDRIQGEFYENQRAVVDDLDRRRALKPGLDVKRAADLLWALNHPDTYLLLTARCGWSPDEHEEWLVGVLRSQLLDTGAG